jgi:hypothetical protein
LSFTIPEERSSNARSSHARARAFSPSPPVRYSPNRYGLPAHFELHVWAWRENPDGAFVDWNNKVTCEGK